MGRVHQMRVDIGECIKQRLTTIFQSSYLHKYGTKQHISVGVLLKKCARWVALRHYYESEYSVANIQQRVLKIAIESLLLFRCKSAAVTGWW